MKVSVIVPAYNEEKYIEKCLESIVSQTEKPDEIIVVDNNCNDKTVEIAEKFGARIVKEENQGMIYARNAGFDAAKYEILARTDSDAILPKDWISKIKENFKDPDLGGLSSPAYYFNKPLISGILNAVIIASFDAIGFKLGHSTMFGPNTVLRKSLWEKIRKDVCLSEREVHEDVDLAIHLAPHTKIKFDKSFIVRTRRNRWLEMLTVDKVKLVKMLASHKKI